MLDWPDLDAPELDNEELDRTLELAKKRSHALRNSRTRRRSIIAAITLSLTVALVSVTVLLPDGPKGSTRASRGASNPTHVVAAPSWKLVSEVGSSWQVVSPIGDEPTDPGFGLTCPTTTTCYAENSENPGTQVEITHDGGAHWQQSTLPADISRTSGLLACTDADTCSVLGQDGSGNGYLLRTDDGGQTWSSRPGPWHVSTGSIVALSCSTTASCLAAVSSVVETVNGDSGKVAPGGDRAFITTDGGESWSESELPQGFVALRGQCLAGGVCLLVGIGSGDSGPGAALYSTDGGSTWSPAPVPAGTGPLNSLSCIDAGQCFATAFGGATYGPSPSEVLVTTDGGRSWSATNTGDLPNSFLDSISCPGSSDCWVSGVVQVQPSETGPDNQSNQSAFADAEGLLAMTADEGQSWQTSQLPEDVHAVWGVSCPTTTTCFALGFQKQSSGSGEFVFLSYRN